MALVSTAGAVACQISASPACPLARRTRVQARPAPLTVTLCAAGASGPSLPTNASSVSPAAAVWKAGVVSAPRPCTLSCACMTKQVIGGAGFCTVTVTGADGPTLPLVSVAWAVRTCEPSDARVVSHWMAYGGEVTSPPSGAPSRKNRTAATATLSLASAATGTWPDTIWPLAGLVMLTVGGILSTGAVALVTSTAARFHWSAVGAVSLRVMRWPAAEPGDPGDSVP